MKLYDELVARGLNRANAALAAAGDGSQICVINVSALIHINHPSK